MTPQFPMFDTTDLGHQDGIPVIRPWKRVPLSPSEGRAWIVTGDVDGDGKAEIVSARNIDKDDVHYTAAVAAWRLDGSLLWKWGNFANSRPGLHHDVAAQIYDWDGDGRNEVILLAQDCLVELDGATGAERRRFPIPPQASDCLVFADLTGRGRATDVLVKDRYNHIWAFDREGRELWSVERPGGYKTAHQPLPLDIDGDGRDEILAGYALLNPDGTVRWTMAAEDFPLGKGHMDCCRAFRRGQRPEDWRLVMSLCGDYRLVMLDGAGRVVWHVGGEHFESIDVGKVFAEVPGNQICVDVVDQRHKNSVWVLDEDGRTLGRIAAEYTRFHALLDFNNDGIDEIVLPHARGIFDGRGRRVATLEMDAPSGDLKLPGAGEIGHMVRRGDMDGDGISDLTITAAEAIFIFQLPGPKTCSTLGCGTNATLY